MNLQPYVAKTDVKVEGTKFTGSMRNPNQGDSLEVDDVFTIPANYMERCFAATNIKDREGNPVAFLLLDCKNKVSGASKVIRFFPNQLAKVFFAVGEDNHVTKLKTTGAVTDVYLKHLGEEDEIDNALQDLVGRPIRVAKREEVKVRSFNNPETLVATAKYEYVFDE